MSNPTDGGPALDAAALRAVFTNDVIRAIGALARQQNVCREQGGAVVFVTGMDAAREYIVEHVGSIGETKSPREAQDAHLATFGREGQEKG